MGFAITVTHTRQGRRVFSYLTCFDSWTVDKGDARVFDTTAAAYKVGVLLPTSKGQHWEIVAVN